MPQRRSIDRLPVVGPSLVPAEEEWRRVPFVARLVERAGGSGAASDIGGMEMFAAAIVSPDPFELAEALAASLEGRP